MMRRRNDGLCLPMTSQQSDTPDGSGLAIHTDAPIVRAARNSSGYTRGSYACVLVAIFLMRWAWLDIHFHDGAYLLHLFVVCCTNYPEYGRTFCVMISYTQSVHYYHKLSIILKLCLTRQCDNAYFQRPPV